MNLVLVVFLCSLLVIAIRYVRRIMAARRARAVAVHSAAMHRAGLRGEVEMWSHNGRDYWWQDGELWFAIAKPRVEANPPSAEALRAGRLVVLGLVVLDGVLVGLLVRFGFWVFGGS